MSFTYTLTTNIGKVRLLIPDNDSTSYDLEDDEITYFLTESGNNVIAAAVKACKWLARKYAKRVTFSADGASFQMTERANAFAARAAELEAELSTGISSVELTRSDGYADTATDSEYESRIVYVSL